MYDHKKQYRCIIIRGKSQEKIDDMLPTYANILEELCPCNKSEFPEKFNGRLEKILNDQKKKTLDNHRTEIAGKLFGMYYEEDNIIYISKRTTQFLSDHDQPAFFKDFCYKMQFPNGMASINTLKDHIKNKLNIRPYSFILNILLLADKLDLKLTKKDIGYYILNSLHVLQGKATHDEVIKQIADDKSKDIKRVVYTPGKESSYNNQHINEQLNYLELANLIIIDTDHAIRLNKQEKDAIRFITEKGDTELMFDIFKHDLTTEQGQKEWRKYFILPCDKKGIFETSVAALYTASKNDKKTAMYTDELDKMQIGEEGELYVFNLEKERVKRFNKRLANKVVYLGKTKGLGYDIQSVIALPNVENPEFAKYIEVKTTKRVTAPDPDDPAWEDTVYLTKNEMDAALQHKELYSIFRVYFCRNGVIIFVINDICRQKKEETVIVTPTSFRVDICSNSITEKKYLNASRDDDDV